MVGEIVSIEIFKDVSTVLKLPNESENLFWLTSILPVAVVFAVGVNVAV